MIAIERSVSPRNLFSEQASLRSLFWPYSDVIARDCVSRFGYKPTILLQQSLKEPKANGRMSWRVRDKEGTLYKVLDSGWRDLDPISNCYANLSMHCIHVQCEMV